MIGKDLFREELARVMLTFPNVKVSAEMVAEYYRVLSPRMSDDQFRMACESIRCGKLQYPPRPADFLDAGTETSESALKYQALGEWSEVTDSRNWTGNGRYNFLRPEVKAGLSSRALFALEKVGEQRLDEASERDRDFLRTRFLEFYLLASEHEIESARRLSGRRYGPTLGAVPLADAVDAFAPEPERKEIR